MGKNRLRNGFYRRFFCPKIDLLLNDNELLNNKTGFIYIVFNFGNCKVNPTLQKNVNENLLR